MFHRLRSAGAKRLLRPAATFIRPLKTKSLTIESINQRVVQAEYAVRGELVIRAGQLDATLAAGKKATGISMPFKNIIYCNIGNPHSVGQSPLTFHRQVLALCMYPQMMWSGSDTGQRLGKFTDLEDSQPLANFPSDVIERAKAILGGTGGHGLGAYSHSKGVAHIRETVAQFIGERDNSVAADPEEIFLTNGASEGVGRLMDLVVTGPEDGVMIPIPQYPLYSSGLTVRGGTAVPYYLNEAEGWGLSIEGLRESITTARADGVDVKMLVVINPGNPTGQLLGYDNMAAIVKFCAEENLVLCADEVYQENIYIDDRNWSSFRKVMLDTDCPIELFSFHSTSKGYFGECGLRLHMPLH